MPAHSRRLFALDQNFPEPIVDALSQYIEVQQKKPETAADRLAMIAEKQATAVVDLVKKNELSLDESRKGGKT
jgi:hypothetical protein